MKKQDVSGAVEVENGGVICLMRVMPEGDVSEGLVGQPVIVNQLSEPTADGQPDENARANCVLASFASGCQFFGYRIWGDQLKDAIFGQSYLGGTNPEAVAPKIEGITGGKVKSWVVHGTPAELLTTVKSELDKGHLVVIEIPSRASDHTNPPQSVTIPSGDQLAPGVGTHANIVYGYQNGNLVVMDPWTGWVHTAPEAWWQSQFVYGRVEPVSGGTSVLQPSDVAGWFDVVDATHWRCVRSGLVVGMAILDAYRRFDGLGRLGLPISAEMTLPGGGAALQVFERGALCWDPGRKIDGAAGWPASEQCYFAHVDSGKAFEVLSASIASQLAHESGLNQQLAATNSQLSASNTQLTSDNASLKAQLDAQAHVPAALAAAQAAVDKAAGIMAPFVDAASALAEAKKDLAS